MLEPILTGSESLPTIRGSEKLLLLDLVSICGFVREERREERSATIWPIYLAAELLLSLEMKRKGEEGLD